MHKVFSSTFEHFPNGRGEHPFRMARMSAIDVGIHAIRAGRHLCDEALRYLWTGTSRHFLLLTAPRTGCDLSQPKVANSLPPPPNSLAKELTPSAQLPVSPG